MMVRELVDLCAEFQRLVGSDAPTVTFSAAWHPATHRQSMRIPQESAVGIYVYAECAAPNWDLPAQNNPAEVWYIGGSNTHLGGRVWSHLGNVIDPLSGKPHEPPFRQHRWVNVRSVPDEIGAALASGDLVVYTAAMLPLGPLPGGWPMALEKSLLLQHFLTHRCLPKLNLSF